jgi:uncharacterized protein (TIGR03067 family)
MISCKDLPPAVISFQKEESVMAIMELETTVHPSDENLSDFFHGRLPADEAAVVEEHLAHCEPCCLLVENTPNDSFMGRLRAAHELPSVDTLVDLASNTLLEEPGELANHPRYRVVRPLGRGGMGAVYLAEHRRLGRSVALKVINPELLNHGNALSRFQQEVKAAAKLDHPNIVAAYDADQAGCLHFLVMEYVEGQNLADYLNEKGPLPIAQACDIIRQAALGLQHAHERGMVHRDIKPHNLMLTPSGQVKVLDFGLARFAAEPAGATTDDGATTAPHLTGAGAVMGSADYIAPEQARDARSADGRSDIYSVGCTLYHLLTGRPPFPDGTAPEKLQRHSIDEPGPLSALRPEAPDGLAKAVAKMMAKKPEERYQTAADVAAALSPFTKVVKPRRFKIRRTLLAFAGLALVVFALAVAAGIVRIPLGNDRELVIETDVPDIEVIVKGDRIVRIVDPKTGKAYQLDRNDMTLSTDDPDGLSVVLDGQRPIVIKRQGKQVATVRLETNSAKVVLEQLQGEWALLYHHQDGVKYSSARTFKFKENTWESKEGDRVANAGTFRFVNLNADPKRFDLLIAEGQGKGGTITAIFKVDGDVLHYCGTDSGKPDPTDSSPRPATAATRGSINASKNRSRRKGGSTTMPAPRSGVWNTPRMADTC